MEPIAIKDVGSGTIKVYENADPDFPGFCVMFQPKDCDFDIDLMLVEAPQDDVYTDYEVGSLNMYLWGDVFNEDYTDKRVVSKQDIDDMVKHTK